MEFAAQGFNASVGIAEGLRRDCGGIAEGRQEYVDQCRDRLLEKCSRACFTFLPSASTLILAFRIPIVL